MEIERARIHGNPQRRYSLVVSGNFGLFLEGGTCHYDARNAGLFPHDCRVCHTRCANPSTTVPGHEHAATLFLERRPEILSIFVGIVGS